ncbi:MAG: hypothetical protein JW768_11600 [Chitinispirillaceae bacterium]|nr:hypothetical protein [Chitinispirillaceae bacterium]
MTFVLRLLLCCALLAQPAVNAGEKLLRENNAWRFAFVGDDTGSCWAKSDPALSCTTVTVPHTFPKKSDGDRSASGIGWYFTDLPITPLFLGKDVVLECDGVCLRAQVFVNGVYAGESRFPYVPFSVNIGPYLPKQGSARIAIKVDNRLRENELPDIHANGWVQYGGLVRAVRLSVLSKERIDRVSVQTFHHADDTFDLGIHLFLSSSIWDSVVCSITAPGSRKPHVTAIIRGTDTTFRVNAVREWTPESPYRYRMTFIPWLSGQKGDTLELLRGFCQVTAGGTQLLLNGRPLYLCGMSRHDVLDGKGPVLGREERRRDLVDMKSLGVNFLRIAHFPQSHDIYDLCDSLGILVMDEAPAWKTDAAFLGSTRGREYGTAYMRRLVAAHGNHTCVCMWSLGNQFTSYKKAVAHYVKTVSAATKSADPSRLTTYCSYHYLWDRGFPYVDVISINEYFGWELASLPLLSKVLDNLHNDWPDKPLIVSEFGAQAGLGVHNAAPQLAGILTSMLSKDLSEEHQALYIGSHLDTIWAKRSYVNGIVVWAYADYFCRMNKARTTTMPAGINACGIVTTDRKRKQSYTTVKERFGMIHANSVTVCNDYDNRLHGAR